MVCLWFLCVYTHIQTHMMDVYTFTHTYTHTDIYMVRTIYEPHVYTHTYTQADTHMVWCCVWLQATVGGQQPILYGERDIMFTDVQLSHHDLFVLCKVQRPSWLWVCHLFWVSFETLEGFWFFLNLEKWLLLFCFSSGNLCGWPGWQAQWQLYKRCFLYFMEADPGEQDFLEISQKPC